MANCINLFWGIWVQFQPHSHETKLRSVGKPQSKFKCPISLDSETAESQTYSKISEPQLDWSSQISYNI